MAKATTGTEVPKKRGSSRNRSAGHNFELYCRNLMRKIGFPHVVSCRSENRTRDGEKIDLINANELVNGRLPYNIQCKNQTTIVDYAKILATGHYKNVTPKSGTTKKRIFIKPMPKVDGVINVIFHKFTSNRSKENKTGKFMPQGNFAILELQDFLEMVHELQARRVADSLGTKNNDKGTVITVNPKYAHLLNK